MPYSYEVKEMRDTRTIAHAGQPSPIDSIATTWTTQYQVIVTATGGDELKDLSPADLVNAPGLPEVNKDTYYFAGQVLPFVVCRNKTATMDRRHLGRWVVTCQYQSRSNDVSNPIFPPAALTDITPLEEVEMNESPRYLWTDYAGQTYSTPVGTFWDEPLWERRPRFTLKITQYEAYIPYSEMIRRMLKCNETPYRGTDRYTWLITDIEPIETYVELAAGRTQCAQVTYTIVYNDDTLVTDNGTKTYEVFWREARALITWKYFESLAPPKNLQPFVDEKLKTETTGFIDKDGLQKTGPVDANGVVQPDYILYEQQPTTDFNTFMQV